MAINMAKIGPPFMIQISRFEKSSPSRLLGWAIQQDVKDGLMYPMDKG
jgi:hypothetical protein